MVRRKSEEEQQVVETTEESAAEPTTEPAAEPAVEPTAEPTAAEPSADEQQRIVDQQARAQLGEDQSPPSSEFEEVTLTEPVELRVNGVLYKYDKGKQSIPVFVLEVLRRSNEAFKIAS